MFLNCSTCFGRHTAHHQELKNCNWNLWFYICFWLPAAAIAEPSQRPATKNVCKTRGCNYSFLSSWWWAVYCPKCVEQLRNTEIINSTTRLHLVWSFLWDLNLSDLFWLSDQTPAVFPGFFWAKDELCNDIQNLVSFILAHRMLSLLIVNQKVWQKILQEFWNSLFSRRVMLLYF
jgi:hypothetical protein